MLSASNTGKTAAAANRCACRQRTGTKGGGGSDSGMSVSPFAFLLISRRNCSATYTS